MFFIYMAVFLAPFRAYTRLFHLWGKIQKGASHWGKDFRRTGRGLSYKAIKYLTG